ncbi:MAG: hypothetical protein AB7D34_01285 [Sulfurimonas sp.]
MPFLRICEDCGDEKMLSAKKDAAATRCRACSAKQIGLTKKRGAALNQENLKRYKRVCVDCKEISCFRSKKSAAAERCAECSYKKRAKERKRFFRVCSWCDDKIEVKSRHAAEASACISCAAKMKRAIVLAKTPRKIKIEKIKREKVKTKKAGYKKIGYDGMQKIVLTKTEKADPNRNDRKMIDEFLRNNIITEVVCNSTDASYVTGCKINIAGI